MFEIVTKFIYLLFILIKRNSNYAKFFNKKKEMLKNFKDQIATREKNIKFFKFFKLIL